MPSFVLLNQNTTYAKTLPKYKVGTQVLGTLPGNL